MKKHIEFLSDLFLLAFVTAVISGERVKNQQEISTNTVNQSSAEEQRQHNGTKTVSLIYGAGQSGPPHAHKMNLYTDPAPFAKINSKWIRDLNANL